MIDREKVIKDLDELHRLIYQSNVDGEILGSLHDAVTLLKEQHEQKTGRWTVLDFCANEGIYCSECHMKIFDHATKPKKKFSQYCPHCGSRNEQFFRDGEVVFR